MEAAKFDTTGAVTTLQTLDSPSRRSFTLLPGIGHDTYSIDSSCNIAFMRGTFPYMCSDTQLTSTTSNQTRADSSLASALDNALSAAAGTEHTY
jgi:hypothetical protein